MFSNCLLNVAMERAWRMHKEPFLNECLQHMDALYHFAVRLAGNTDLAADLVQETYLKAIRHQEQFQEGTNLKAWLFTILKNLHLNRAARARKEEPLETGSEAQQGSNVVSYPFALPGEQLRWITQEDLEKALADLPEIFRDALLLADYEGFSYREIAAILDVPAGTVMSRISRARRAMRVRLAPYAAKRMPR